MLTSAILAGALLMGLNVLIHSSGTVVLLRFVMRYARPLHHRFPLMGRGLIMLAAAVLLMLIHVAEISTWAVAYLQAPDIPEIDSFTTSFYFSSVTYTTLGYGDIVLDHDSWRLACGLEALNGILLCGWSTALLFVLVEQLWLRELGPRKRY